MLRLKAQVTPEDFENLIERVMRRQLPRAQAAAINATAADVRQNTLKRIRKRFHKPVPYMTKTAVFATRATAQRPRAIVGIKDHQATLYRWQEKGGVRRPERRKYPRGGSGTRMIPIPAKIRTDAYDNMTFKAIPKALRRKDTFQAGSEENLRPGIYRREKHGDGLDLLVRFQRKAKYKRRFSWGDMAKKTIMARFPVHFRAAVERELANPVFRNKRGQSRF
mgnify:CR=1 FL=1